MKWYAEIDETGYCFHTTQTELPLSDTILLADENVIGMTWDGGKWNESEQEETPEPTQLDRIENRLSLLTEDTAEYKAFYEAAKEILPEGSEV